MQRGSEREIYLKIMAVILFAADSRTDQLFYPNLSNHPDWDPSAQTLICPPRNALCLLSWHFEDYLPQPRLLPVVYLAPKIVGTMCSVYCEWIYPEQRCREEDPDPGAKLNQFTCSEMWGVTSYHQRFTRIQRLVAVSSAQNSLLMDRIYQQSSLNVPQIFLIISH